jgi:hypothetical protein
MTSKAWILGFLVLVLASSVGAPVAFADSDDDDDDYVRYGRFGRVGDYRPYGSSYYYGSPWVGPRTYGAPMYYRTYTTYNPWYDSSYGYYDTNGYRYYRDDTGRVLGRVLLNAVMSGALR